MSQENVELTRRAIESLNARDRSAIADLYDEAVEWRPALTAGGAIEGQVYEGHAGVARYLEDVDAGFVHMHFAVERIEEVGSDQVLLQGGVRARGEASGVPIDVSIWNLLTFRDGKICRAAGFLREEEALQAAGLSEWGRPVRDVRELVGDLYPALMAADKERIFELLAEDFHSDVTPGMPLGMGGTRDTAASMWREVWAVIGRNYEIRVEPGEWIACDDGRLLVRGRYLGRGRESGIELDAWFAHLWTARAGRISELWHVTDSARFAAALGVE
jgi:2-(1,2-epoxy-1,2-dihydrophenyl)acetyl-CoA isomerase